MFGKTLVIERSEFLMNWVILYIVSSCLSMYRSFPVSLNTEIFRIHFSNWANFLSFMFVEVLTNPAILSLHLLIRNREVVLEFPHLWSVLFQSPYLECVNHSPEFAPERCRNILNIPVVH